MNITKIFLATICIITLAGCAPKPDPKIVELEQQVNHLQARLDANDQLQTALENLIKANEAAQTNRNFIFATEIDILKIRLDKLENPSRNN